MAGVVTGAAIAVLFLDGDRMPEISGAAKKMFASWGLRDFTRLQPADIFSAKNLLSAGNLVLIIVGGFMVGFGTRYGNGCTSGHAIMGLSLLSGGSLVAVVGFFAGGLLFSHLLIPYIVAW